LPGVNLEEIEAALAAHPLVEAAKAEMRADPDGAMRIVASVVPAAAAYEVPESLMTEYTETWRRVHDAKYEPEPDDPAWDTAVWIDSYRMQPIPTEEMQEWTNETTARILALRPRRILEIGCGSGLLLYRLAPNCEEYVGLDFSKRVIDRLEADIARRSADLSHVKVLHREAQALEEFADHGFDLVIINSVVMFLPSAAYLETVLERALRTLASGGRIFIGDVRDCCSLELFHLTIAMARAPAQADARQLLTAAGQSLATEKQLLLPPSFFTRFASKHPRISGIRIDLKRGAARNEMNRFRFDATLATDRAPGVETKVDNIDGRTLRLDTIVRLLRDSPARRLKISGLENARLTAEAKFLSQLSSGQAEGAGALHHLPSSEGVEPSAVAAAAMQLGLNCCLQPSESLDPARFNAILWPRNEIEPCLVWRFKANQDRIDMRDEMNGQFRVKIERNLVKMLSSLLSSRAAQSALVEVKIVPASKNSAEPLAMLHDGYGGRYNVRQ